MTLSLNRETCGTLQIELSIDVERLDVVQRLA